MASEAIEHRPRPLLPMARPLLRGILVLVTIALALVWYVERRRGSTSGVDLDKALVFTLLPGPQFGTAQVYLGDNAQGDPLADDRAIETAVRTVIGKGKKTEVVIQAAPGVVHGEVMRVYEAASRGLDSKSDVPFHLTMLVD